MKVLITGGKGQLGRACARMLSPENIVLSPGKEKLDITDGFAVERYVSGFGPDLIIHCGALTDVDRCEEDPAGARLINADGTSNMAAASLLTGARFIYISTNFVFNGCTQQPYREGDQPDPINSYGLTKFMGEDYIRQNLTDYCIIRTSWLYGPGGENFVSRVCSLVMKNRKLQVVGDQIATPTLVDDLAAGMSTLITTGSTGTYHITNDGYCSRCDWVERIIHRMGIDVQLEEVSSDYFTLPAKRPEFASLDCQKFQYTTGTVLRSWEEALDSYLEELGR